MSTWPKRLSKSGFDVIQEWGQDGRGDGMLPKLMSKYLHKWKTFWPISDDVLRTAQVLKIKQPVYQPGGLERGVEGQYLSYNLALNDSYHQNLDPIFPTVGSAQV